MITLGQIRDDIQADYFDTFTDIKAVRRATKKVLDQINLKLQGIDTLEDGLEMIVAPITEDVAFDAVHQVITPTTDPDAIAEPGDVMVVYGSEYNNRAYNISYVDTLTINPIPSDPPFTEAFAECTYAIYRPLRKVIVKDVVMTDLTYDNGAHTITSAGNELDFLEIGLKEDDIFRLNGATEDVNNALFEVSSATATVITVKTLGSSGTLDASTANDPAKITIYAPPQDLYSYNLEQHSVTAPESVKLLNGITKAATELTSRSYQYVKDSDNDSANAFAPIGRLMAAMADTMFTGAGDILRFNVKRDLLPPTASYPDTVIEIPRKYEGTLYLGVVKEIASRPGFYNKDVYDQIYTEYTQALGQLDYTEPSINPPIEYKLKFHL